MIHLLKYENEYDWILQVKGDFVAFAVTGEAYDYVEETSIRMRQLARKLFHFPFYLTFESYYDTQAYILKEDGLNIRYKPSGRTVLTQIGHKSFQAEVPSFTVEIPNEQILNIVFENWFNYAFDNHLWALMQDDTVTYENGFADVELKKNETILVTEHDAYGFTVITNQLSLQNEQGLLLVLKDTYIE